MNKRIVIRCHICGKKLDFASNSIERVEPMRVVQYIEPKENNNETEVDFVKNRSRFCKECKKLIISPQERKRFPIEKILNGNARDLPKFT